jgi:hypothetical protein
MIEAKSNLIRLDWQYLNNIVPARESRNVKPEMLKTALVQALGSKEVKRVHDAQSLKRTTTRDPLGPMMYAEEERWRARGSMIPGPDLRREKECESTLMELLLEPLVNWHS